MHRPLRHHLPWLAVTPRRRPPPRRALMAFELSWAWSSCGLSHATGMGRSDAGLVSHSATLAGRPRRRQEREFVDGEEAGELVGVGGQIRALDISRDVRVPLGAVMCVVPISISRQFCRRRLAPFSGQHCRSRERLAPAKPTHGVPRKVACALAHRKQCRGAFRRGSKCSVEVLALDAARILRVNEEAHNDSFLTLQGERLS